MKARPDSRLDGAPAQGRKAVACQAKPGPGQMLSKCLGNGITLWSSVEISCDSVNHVNERRNSDPRGTDVSTMQIILGF